MYTNALTFYEGKKESEVNIDAKNLIIFDWNCQVLDMITRADRLELMESQLGENIINVAVKNDSDFYMGK